jgi:hypothetical protein
MRRRSYWPGGGRGIDGWKKKNVIVSAEGEDVQERIGEDGDMVLALKKIIELGEADILILP